MCEPHLTTEQANFSRAIEAMKRAMLRQGKRPAWLVVAPADLVRLWGAAQPSLCGLAVAEFSWCRAGRYYVVDDEDYRRLAGRAVADRAD